MALVSTVRSKTTWYRRRDKRRKLRLRVSGSRRRDHHCEHAADVQTSVAVADPFCRAPAIRREAVSSPRWNGGGQRRTWFNTVVAKTVGTVSDGVVAAEASTLRQRVSPSVHLLASLAFAGSIKRYGVSTTDADNVGYEQVGKLGVHQFYDQRILGGLDHKIFDALDRYRDQVMVALLLEYLHRMGVSSDLLAIAGKVLPSDVHWLSDDEIRSIRLDNVDVASTASLIGYANGVATVVVGFSRADADYTVELFCGSDAMLEILAKIRSRFALDPRSLEDSGDLQEHGRERAPT